MRHYLGCLTWRQVCQANGIDFDSLPRNVARRTKRGKRVSALGCWTRKSVTPRLRSEKGIGRVLSKFTQCLEQHSNGERVQNY